MNDLFEREQKFYDDALIFSSELKKGASFDVDKYHVIVEEYGRLLKHLRRFTKMSDRTTIALNDSMYDLLDKIHYDALTNIRNRRFLEDNFKRIVESVARKNDVLSIMMIDIDCFKKYNDTYGHDEGDVCLKTVARTIAKTLLRPDDLVVRYGGEEFTVILPGTNESGALFIANKILESIRELKIPHAASEVAKHITISIGATTCKAERSQSMRDYIKCSDEALYLSKRSGRDCYTFKDFKEAE